MSAKDSDVGWRIKHETRVSLFAEHAAAIAHRLVEHHHVISLRFFYNHLIILIEALYRCEAEYRSSEY